MVYLFYRAHVIQRIPFAFHLNVFLFLFFSFFIPVHSLSCSKLFIGFLESVCTSTRKKPVSISPALKSTLFFFFFHFCYTFRWENGIRFHCVSCLGFENGELSGSKNAKLLLNKGWKSMEHGPGLI